jgi:methionyl-tRNA formyltransferase
MVRFSCVLVTNTKHHLFDDIMALLRAHSDDIAPLHFSEIARTNPMMAGRDMLISIYNERLFTADQLRCTNVNIHPSSPEYPGRGNATLPIYDGVEETGPVAHIMEERPDSGPILLYHPLKLYPWETTETLFSRCGRAAVDLLARVLDHYSREGKLPPPNDMKWTKRPMTTKQFNQWLVLDLDNPQDAKRKINAARHSRYPGPYVFHNGIKLGLVSDDYTGATVEVFGYKFAEVAPKLVHS